MSNSILHASEDSFEQDVLASETPVLVDFWAEWCGPCRSLAPVIDDVAEAYGERLRVVKINVDQNQALVPKFGVRGIPTIMVFKDGAPRATRVGAMTKAELTAFIDQSL